MKTSQEQWIKNQLLTKGKVSRNECLRRYITRASARILDLKEGGMNIQGYWKKTKQGRDYIYELI